MRRIVCAALVAASLFTMPAAPVGAADRTVRILGDDKFVANTMVASTFKFEPGPLRVAQGDTVTWSNTTDEPHTVSIVRQDQLPQTAEQAFDCAICGDIFAAHGDPNAPAPVVNNGQPGLDTAFVPGTSGDSLFIGPKGTPGSPVTATISAPSGTTLYYLCAIHPWMQGSIRVN